MSLKAIVKAIKDFPETKDLKYEHYEISTVYQYVQQKKAFDPDDPKQLYEPILKENPIRIEYRPSKAYEKLQLQNKKTKFIDTTYHNDYLLDAKMEDFDLLNEERVEVLEKAKKFIDGFEKKTLLKGLYFYGQNRTGKTFLLSAIVNELSKQEVKIVFAYVPDLIRHIHASIDEGLLEEKVANLKNCDLLVFDDLGGAFMNRWFRDQIFGPIIQYRLNVGLPVLISSNFSLEKLANFMTDSNIENDKYSAVRIVSRIQEMTETVELSKLRYR